VRNPVDVAGAADSNPGVFADAFEVLVDEPGVAGVLLVGLFGGYHLRYSKTFEDVEMDAAGRLMNDAGAAGKPVVVHSMYANADSPPLTKLRQGGVPVTASLDIACRCAEVVVRRRDLLRRAPIWGREDLADPDDEAGPGDSASSTAPPTSLTALTEWQAREELSAHGVSFPPGRLVRTRHDLARLSWDSPMAMKIVSAGIPHKTEADGVLLNVTGPSEAEAGMTRLMDSARTFLEDKGSAALIEGVLVTEMIPAAVAELLIGVRRMPRLGCVLTVGAGGTRTEALDDVTHRVLPIHAEEVEEMLLELGIAPVLAGARGQPPVSLRAVSELALAVARYALDDPSIMEVELNPVFAYADRALPVDALVVQRE
jgi:acetyltransferase